MAVSQTKTDKHKDPIVKLILYLKSKKKNKQTEIKKAKLIFSFKYMVGSKGSITCSSCETKLKNLKTFRGSNVLQNPLNMTEQRFYVRIDVKTYFFVILNFKKTSLIEVKNETEYEEIKVYILY